MLFLVASTLVGTFPRFPAIVPSSFQNIPDEQCMNSWGESRCFHRSGRSRDLETVRSTPSLTAARCRFPKQSHVLLSYKILNGRLLCSNCWRYPTDPCFFGYVAVIFRGTRQFELFLFVILLVSSFFTAFRQLLPSTTLFTPFLRCCFL